MEADPIGEPSLQNAAAAKGAVHYHPLIRDRASPWKALLPGVLAGIALLPAALAFLREGTGTALLLAAMVLLALAAAAWLLLPAYFRYPIPELNDPPVVDERVPLEGHGTVHLGHTDVPGGTRPRPYVWIWLEPPLAAPCNYQWYQFARPTAAIDGRPINSDREFEAATERKARYGQWNPDYHVTEVPPGAPGFNPDGLGLDPDDPGKPYRQYHVPGTRLPGSSTSVLTGILDAPNLCVRSATKHAEVELFLESEIPDHEQTVVAAAAPPDQNVNVRITIELRSYLVCIDRDGNVHCIGYIPWTYINDVDVRLTWREGGIEAGTQRRWNLASQVTRCDHSYEFGDWSNC